jgi:hypothetical protein
MSNSSSLDLKNYSLKTAYSPENGSDPLIGLPILVVAISTQTEKESLNTSVPWSVVLFCF